LVELGHAVEIYVLSPQDWGGQTKLDYHGIQFSALNNYAGKNKVLKHYHALKAIFKAKRLVKEKAGLKKLTPCHLYH
jgi:hypothetical protein